MEGVGWGGGIAKMGEWKERRAEWEGRDGKGGWRAEMERNEFIGNGSGVCLDNLVSIVDLFEFVESFP